MFIDGYVLFAVAIAVVGMLVVYIVEDQDSASPLCSRCHALVGYDYCTLCNGSGRRETPTHKGSKTVSCTHHIGLDSQVVCLSCRGSTGRRRRPIRVPRPHLGVAPSRRTPLLSKAFLTYQKEKRPFRVAFPPKKTSKDNCLGFPDARSTGGNSLYLDVVAVVISPPS